MSSSSTAFIIQYSSQIEKVLSEATYSRLAEIFKVKPIIGMTARSTSLSQVEQCKKLLYNYLQAICKKEEDWSSHLATAKLRHNHCSVTESIHFSLYFCLKARNLVISVDSKTLRSKHSGNTEVDEYARALLSKLDHIRELARLNVIDFKENFKKAYDKKYKTKPTKLRVVGYVYIEEKRMKIGDSSHLTSNFVGPYVISE